MLNVMAHNTKKNEPIKFLNVISIVIIPDFMKIHCSFRFTTDLTFSTVFGNNAFSYVIPNIPW